MERVLLGACPFLEGAGEKTGTGFPTLVFSNDE
jgi:hypothetical protein